MITSALGIFRVHLVPAKDVLVVIFITKYSVEGIDSGEGNSRDLRQEIEVRT